MRINEVMLSSGGDDNVQFIELRDPSAEPFANGPYRVEVYDDAGVLIDEVVLPAVAGVMPILISTPAADNALGTDGDVELTVALPANGQACFVRAAGSKIHCLAWGCIGTLVTGSASRGASPPDGQSLQRQSNGTYQLAAPTPDDTNVAGDAAEACTTEAPDAGANPPGPDAAVGPGSPDAAAVESPDAAPSTGGDDDGGGCGCRVPRSHGGAGAPIAVAALALAALVMRRRRR